MTSTFLSHRYTLSDAIGGVHPWDYRLTCSRLRTLPYLPPSERPDVITSREGKAIAVDKVKVEGKERILKRGEVSGRWPVRWCEMYRQNDGWAAMSAIAIRLDCPSTPPYLLRLVSRNSHADRRKSTNASRGRSTLRRSSSFLPPARTSGVSGG